MVCLCKVEHTVFFGNGLNRTVTTSQEVAKEQ